MLDVPERFRSGPFARSEALEAGITARVLEGVQFVRLQVVGLDHGPCAPLHFVVVGDHHLATRGVFLHRTVSLPPGDEDGVSVEAAFIAYCAEARVIDAIKVGSMLLQLGWLELGSLQTLLVEEPWRRGCAEAQWVIEHLEGRCRSIPEAVLFALVRFSGLPEPEVNPELRDDVGNVVIPDLWFARWRQAVEYEGSHHQEDRDQYNSDIDRYLTFRTLKIPYLQVTKERMRKPRLAMRQIYHALVAAGYDGPESEFGELWATLFRRLSDVVRPARPPRAVSQPHSAA